MLKKLRKDRQLSLKDVANELGVSDSFLSQIENGKRKPSAELIVSIADYYKIQQDPISVSLGIVPAWILSKMKEAPFEVVTAATDHFKKYGK